MGKGKKRKAPSGGRRGGSAGAAAEAPPNLFERLSSKKRFDILGRKVKGDTKQLGKLRTAAAERRKGTLLVEYRQLRKNNAFIDRRFGEDDASLTADEKALLRFQKQRLKEMAGSKFTLPDDDEEGPGGAGGAAAGEQLTHLGRSLAELEDLQEGWRSDDEDEDGRLGEQLVRDFHFGGGLFEKKAGGGGADEEEGSEGGRPQKKSKKEVMEELIAKSKAFKAEKQRQREEDLDETAALDDQFRSLMGDRALLGLLRKKGEKRDNRGETQDDRAFDVLTRELVFEAKAQPGERTLTAEELAEHERQRLEALEAARKRRMAGEGEQDEEEEAEEGGDGLGGGAPAQPGALPAGGYAARRAKRARAEELSAGRRRLGGDSGDALEDDFVSGSEEEGSEDDDGWGSGSEGEDGSGSEGEGAAGLTKLERRRQQRAAGSHPLQEAFRQASAKLLKKHRQEAGEDVSSGEEEDEEEGGSSDEEGEGSSSEEEEEEEESGEDGQALAGSSSEEEEEEEEKEEARAAAAELLGSPKGSGSSSGEEASEGGSEEEEEEESEQEEEAEEEQRQRGKAAAPRPAKGSAEGAAAAVALPPGVSADLPFTPPLPDSYEAFEQLARGRSAADLGELVRRMRVVHAASLTGQNRKRLQLLYGILVQHFASLAGGAGSGGSGGSGKTGGKGKAGAASSGQQQQGRVPMEHLDALVPHLLELTPQVPFYAATLARARLQRAQERLSECLRDPVLRAEAWPAPRVLLLLKLFATVFPASDKRHPVLTPAALLACSCLANCPVAKPQHAATGLYLASLALHLNSQAQRYVPEALSFAVLMLQSALPAPAADAAGSGGGTRVGSTAASHQRQLEAGDPRWLAVSPGDAGAGELPASPQDIAPLNLVRVLSSCGSGSGRQAAEEGQEEREDGFWRSAGFKTSAAAAAARLVARSAELLAGNAALPELLQPAREALAAVVAQAGAAGGAAVAGQQEQPSSKKQKKVARGKAAAAVASASPGSALVAPGLAALCRSVLSQLDAAAEAVRSSRRPMYNVALLRVAEKRQFNPRFEEDFVSGKDYDPDRERSERRKLQRAVRREERGAARELRRDAAFMSEVRDREKASQQAEFLASERRAKSFLQQQEADFKSGGQGGHWKKGGKGRK